MSGKLHISRVRPSVVPTLAANLSRVNGMPMCVRVCRSGVYRAHGVAQRRACVRPSDALISASRWRHRHRTSCVPWRAGPAPCYGDRRLRIACSWCVLPFL